MAHFLRHRQSVVRLQYFFRESRYGLLIGVLLQLHNHYYFFIISAHFGAHDAIVRYIRHLNEVILQLVGVYILSGLIYYYLFQPSFYIQFAVAQSGDISRREPFVSTRNIFSRDHLTAVKRLPAYEQLAFVAYFVFDRFKRLAYASLYSLAYVVAELYRRYARFCHAEAVIKRITYSIYRFQRIRKYVSSAVYHKPNRTSDQALLNRAKYRRPHNSPALALGVGLSRITDSAYASEHTLLTFPALSDLPHYALSYIVPKHRNAENMSYLVPSARVHYRLGRFILEIHYRLSKERIPHINSHKAKYMVQRQKRQILALSVRSVVHYVAVVLQEIACVIHLMSHGISVVDEHARRARRAGRAEGHLIRPIRRKAFIQLFPQQRRWRYLIIARVFRFVVCYYRYRARRVQKMKRYRRISAIVQQQGLIPRHHYRPKNSRPIGVVVQFYTYIGFFQISHLRRQSRRSAAYHYIVFTICTLFYA